MIESVYDPSVSIVDDSRRRVALKLDREKYASREFKELWSRINRKTFYTVDFDDDEIIAAAVKRINEQLEVTALKATVTLGSLSATDQGSKFTVNEKHAEYIAKPSNSVKYDLLGEIAENAGLLRKTIAAILSQIHPQQFAKYQTNPESFYYECQQHY